MCDETGVRKEVDMAMTESKPGDVEDLLKSIYWRRSVLDSERGMLVIIVNFGCFGASSSHGHRRSTAFDSRFANSRERCYHLLGDGRGVSSGTGVGLRTS